MMLRASATTHDLFVEGEDRTIRYDAEGRWCSLSGAGVLYRRTMDGGVARGAHGVSPRVVPREDALHAEAWDVATRAAARLLPRGDVEPAVRERLMRAAS